ncbi:hypothetical protein PAL_GLEAN10008925 [Pteropus alecto]|uniref:Uncharacterized protein n=1 Tax=Pteropus alecto TaxID=9402 RepID=L5KMK0_PTEAL|nr:hypothetical protein PAL_GLEAN10008925 [Pteropus alecto]
MLAFRQHRGLSSRAGGTFPVDNPLPTQEDGLDLELHQWAIRKMFSAGRREAPRPAHATAAARVSGAVRSPGESEAGHRLWGPRADVPRPCSPRCERHLRCQRSPPHLVVVARTPKPGQEACAGRLCLLGASSLDEPIPDSPQANAAGEGPPEPRAAAAVASQLLEQFPNPDQTHQTINTLTLEAAVAKETRGDGQRGTGDVAPALFFTT